MRKLLKIAVQMDNIATIEIAGDTTFALMLEAQKRGYEIYYYQPDNLSLYDSKVMARCCKIALNDEEDDYYKLDEEENVNLKDVDVVLIRQDPPYNMNYLTYTYLLDKITDKTLVINNPTNVRNCPEKIFVCNFAEFMPPTAISADMQIIEDFQKKYGEIILKPLYAHGGADVFKVDSEDLDIVANWLLEKYKTPIIAQKFIKEVKKGDKRIILINGKPAGAVNRIPEEGTILANFVQGGQGSKTKLTKREEEICKALEKPLQDRGLMLAGIDVINGYLTEINVTSPTGIRAIDDLNGTCLEAIFWDEVEGKLS